MMLTLKSVAAWLVILACAVANGALREALLIPALGRPAALVASGVLLSIVILAVSMVLVPRFGRLGTLQCLSIGLLWLGLTLAFEFGFGRLVQGQSWSELLEAYTFNDGNIWPVVLVVTFIAPFLAVRLRNRS